MTRLFCDVSHMRCALSAPTIGGKAHPPFIEENPFMDTDADVAAPRRTGFPTQRSHRVHRYEQRPATSAPRGTEVDDVDESHLIRGYD